ncbi:hypothetical protein CAPTEDRAFT_229069 [Capitella teleta]|uniref:protein-tyrosine-phosphatase n=1 Tax=Capitella teleta TaxID=283909 RepID=X2B1B9_CAPTE|nr:hypothetical protein CAPTEDRAFT_229069 [Capitella teleta]|eukprot:ELU00302.1 hypothetical protein CAPTEDRAFT_229069 [Capitella teleta]
MVHVFGGDSLLLLLLMLLLRSIQYIAEYEPRITTAPKDMKVMEEGIVSFFCKATGNPTPDIYWQKANRRISSNKSRYFIYDMPNGSVLRIEPARARKDESIYECVADNGIGKPAVASAMLDIYPKDQVPSGYPNVPQGPNLKAVEKDRNTVMTCSATGDPKPQITWLKKSIPVDLTDPRIKLMESGSLQIMESKKSDEGKYECVAENAVGVAYSYGANLYVRVRRVPPHFSIPPEDAEIMPGGSANLTCVAVGSPMPYVKWRLGAVQLTPEESIPIGRNVLELNNIRESANYTCVAASDLGNIEAVAHVKVKALPKAPDNVVTSEVTATSVKLTWSSGNVDPIQSYTITYKPNFAQGSEHPSIPNIMNPEYTVTGLSAYTRYEFRVIAVNNIGQGEPSNPVDVTTGELAPGSPPQNVRAQPVSSSTVVVQWEEPRIPNGMIKGYKVYYTPTPDIPISLWTIHNVDNSRLTTISNLLTNRTYTIRVLAFTDIGVGPLSDAIQVVTQQGVPEQPTNLQGQAMSPNSIQLSWNSPSDSGPKIESYELYFNDSHFRQSIHITIDPPVNEYLLEDLTPDTVYHIRVSAKSTRGEGPSTPTIQERTLQYIPTAPPQDIRAHVVSSRDIDVSWSPPPADQQNGLITGYKVLYTLATSRLGPSDAAVVTSAGTERSARIGNLERWTEYKVWVVASTQVGDGPRSELLLVRTDEDVPGMPRRVHLHTVNSTAVRVNWRPPSEAEHNGIVRGYQIHYVKINDEGEPSGVPGMYDLNEDNKHEVIVNGLTPDTNYQFQVAAYTRKGDGARSRQKRIRTRGAVPSIPRGLELILDESDPPLVRATWQTPRSAYGTITGYRLSYGIKGESTSSRLFAGDVFQFQTPFLERGVEYEFRVAAKNAEDFGEQAVATIQTPDGIPGGAPLNFTAIGESATSVLLQWVMPAKSQRNGEIILYEIMYNRRGDVIEDYTTNTTQRSTLIEGLEPNVDYLFRIRAYTSLGPGPWSNQLPFHTFGRHKPDMVEQFQARTSNPTSIMLEWKPPQKPGVMKYKIEFEGFKRYRDNSGMERTHIYERSDRTASQKDRSYYIDSLVPNTVYTFNITAQFMDGSWGPAFSIHVQTSNDAPTAIPAPEFLRAVSDNIVKVRLHKASEEYGPISHYIVVMMPEEAAFKNPDEYFLNLDEVSLCILVLKPYIFFKSQSVPSTLRLGDGSRTGEYFNQPLTKGQRYVVFVRAYVPGNKFKSSPFSAPFSSDMIVVATPGESKGETDPLWIVGPVCGAVVLILLLVLIIIFVSVPVGDNTIHHPPNDPVELRRLNFQTPAMMSHPPIPITQLADHIEHLKANDGIKFSNEYESIEPGQQFTWDNSNAEVNKPKNRYANVIAYDHSRTVLQSEQGIAGSDYINANFMDGYRKQNAYIATQGALPETFADFWRMVWEQRSASIVMMTKLEERTRLKCDQYWPNRGSESYGAMQVVLIDVMELATYTIRTFQVMKHGYPEKREVRQYQFTAWPDHGVPDHPTPLLLFMRRVKAMTPPDSGPMIVHCSAGVGRTGAFIVIDAMLERIKHEKTVDIYGHVTCLRAQRNYMVQTEDQYVFIHDALLEAVQSGNTEIPARNLYAHIQKLTQPEPGEAITGMDLEFEKLASVKANPSRFASASLAVNKFKNRLVNILPYESTRVCLQPIRGVDGSDYINASFIDGYRYRKAYIATQGPLVETTEDFWRMLWEHNSTIIVMLTKLKEMAREKCHQYWPSERSARYQYFVVDPMAEYNMPQYILREFKVTDARDGQSRTIRQFQFTDWPEQGVPKSGEGFIDFIGQVHKTKEQFGQDGPISVHCSAGAGRTGVFTTLSIVLERMRYEGVVDMFQTVKMLRTQRPAMVQTEDQYAFCYRAALEYLGSFDHYAN